MAVTRREFVTTLGVLAAAAGMSQSQLAQVTQAFGHGGAWAAGGSFTSKPKVIWVHGAECTGCSTSLLSLYEDARGAALADGTTTATALSLITGSTATGAVAKLQDTTVTGHAGGHRTLDLTGYNVDGSAYAVNIADVLIDFIDLQYHETVMAMGGDQAYDYLRTEMDSTSTASPFVLVVEGAVQDKANGGYWSNTAGAPWCSIAMDGTAGANLDLSFDEVVHKLAVRDACKAIVAIGQCASFGGYPACIGPDLVSKGGSKSQTGAQGVYDFLTSIGEVNGATPAEIAAKDKVINVPGCPTNPWWFTLTVVAWMVDAVHMTTGTHSDGDTGPLQVLKMAGGNALAINGAAVDSQRRLTAVYGDLLHGKYCPRYKNYAKRIFAATPGDPNFGCLKNIGCKGLSTMSSCGRHGWNNAQPQNATMNVNASGAGTKTAQVAPLYTVADGGTTKMGGCCLTAGAPCMGCTEKGYPDAFTPFVVR